MENSEVKTKNSNKNGSAKHESLETKSKTNRDAAQENEMRREQSKYTIDAKDSVSI